MRAVGPDIWNNWKGALFQDLYFTVFDASTADLAILARPFFNVDSNQQDARLILEAGSQNASEVLRAINDSAGLLFPCVLVAEVENGVKESGRGHGFGPSDLKAFQSAVGAEFV